MENEVIILVVDKNENPIENAKVTFNNLTKMTDKNGKTTFKISDGMYELKVQNENFVDYSDSVEVNNDMDNYLVNMRSVEDIPKPKSPEISIQQEGNSITLTWEPITENVNDQSIKIDKYKIYGKAIKEDGSVYSIVNTWVNGDTNEYNNERSIPYK